MYGGIIAFRKHLDNPYYLGALSKPSPLDDAFDEACFGWLISDAKSNLIGKGILGDGTAYSRTRKWCFAGYLVQVAYSPQAQAGDAG